MRDLCRAALSGAVLALSGLSGTAFAQTPSAEAILIIRATDGTERITLAGEIVDFDGRFYTIDTIYGELTVPVERAECLGRSCPDVETFTATLRMAAPEEPGRRLVPALLAGWAESQNLVAVEASPQSGQDDIFYLTEPDTGDVRVEVHIDYGGDDAGLIALLQGDVDMALSFHQWRDASVQSHLVALDAYVPVVARDSAVDGLDLSQGLSAALHSPRTRDQGGARALHAMSEGGAFPPVLRERLLPLAEDIRLGAVTLHENPEALIEALNADPRALGLMQWSRVAGLRVLPLTGACGRSLVASADTIRAEDWPLSIPLLLYVATDRRSLSLHSFIRSLYSDTATTGVRASGFVELGPSPISMDHQGGRWANAVLAAGNEVRLTDLQQMLQRLHGAERLAFTFRFEEGSTELDAFSEGALLHLAESVRSGSMQNRTLIFAGFTDSAGSAAANRQLSVDRARAVSVALRRAIPGGIAASITVEVHGFGEASPLACDDSGLGRQVNRRVEVWLR